LCPHQCRVDRISGQRGFCGAGNRAKVALASLHQWEEPCFSGTRGSGTVFFSFCNLRCVYCQNYHISQEGEGRELSLEALAEVFLSLQTRGAHNLNLVSPTPFSPIIAVALQQARQQGLTLPVVYNCNGYEQPAALAALEGLVDVYLPDLKYAYNAQAELYSHAQDYFAVAKTAILEMHRQVGPLQLNDDGLAKRGLLIRHLVLPNQAASSREILQWVRTNLPGVPISLMGQYIPLWQAARFPELNRSLHPGEYENILD
jgi:putative pyruvate formate lyase activating enzyme